MYIIADYSPHIVSGVVWHIKATHDTNKISLTVETYKKILNKTGAREISWLLAKSWRRDILWQSVVLYCRDANEQVQWKKNMYSLQKVIGSDVKLQTSSVSLECVCMCVCLQFALST